MIPYGIINFYRAVDVFRAIPHLPCSFTRIDAYDGFFGILFQTDRRAVVRGGGGVGHDIGIIFIRANKDIKVERDNII